MTCLKNLFTITVTFIFVITSSAQKIQENSRIVTGFDNGWLFHKGDPEGAENPSFDDSQWRKIDVPHDWSIEGSYDQANPTSRGGGYLPAGVGWYRKNFITDKFDKSRKYFIEFDGIMANSDVWINGVHLGKRPYGYSGFSYDLTSALRTGKGERNIVAVRVDNTVQPASRYYTGAGIYRHVRLVETSQVHIEQWGVRVSASDISEKKATINISTAIINESAGSVRLVLETIITDPDGKTVGTKATGFSAEPGKAANPDQKIDVTEPALWDITNPRLYRAVSKVMAGKKIIDEQSSSFGIRDSRFEAATGYWLNGKNIKIKGVCLHHDAGGLGSAVPLSVWQRRLELLKLAGVNAIRTGHNPFAPEFLDLCDTMGFLVMDETFDTWNAAKPNGEKGYNLYFTEWWEKDTRAMVMRDRNHPSVIIYSVGNEIRDNLNDSSGFRKYRAQQNLVHELDPGRPVTMALFRPNSSRVYSNGFAKMMDVVGQNYREKELADYHTANPGSKVLGTENGHGLTEWLILRDNPFMAGQFLWIGFDYLGEALWPAISFSGGLFDRTGEWKQTGLQRQSWWSDKPVVNMVRKSDNDGAGEWVADWTPVDEGTYDKAAVEVYSNCEEVELFLNGNSLGKQEKPADDSPRKWVVTYERGSLKAVGRNNGRDAATKEFSTAGTPAAIRLTADRQAISDDREEVVYVTAVIVDENGITCPNAGNLVSFSISGPGEIIAVDNGNTVSHEMYKATERSVFRGRCIAVLRAKGTTGRITIGAASGNLRPGSATVEVKEQ